MECYKKMTIAFDQFQRYKHVEEIINLIRKDTSYSILEVGANEHKNLEKFLKNDNITYLDIEIPEYLKEDPQYINADATNMPEIETNSFDYVIALDVFEHIPKNLRESFLRETHRVAKKGVIIAAPHKDNEVIQAEIRANEYYKQLYGSGFRWLEEHRENDLPDTNLTKNFYKQNNIDFVYFQHGTLIIWEKMLDLHFLFADKEKYHSQRFLIDEYYNENIYKYDYGEENYRNFFVSLSNMDDLKKVQQWIENRIAAANSDKAIKKEELLNWLENQIKSIYFVKELKELKNQNLKVNELLGNVDELKSLFKLNNEINQISNNLNIEMDSKLNGLHSGIYEGFENIEKQIKNGNKDLFELISRDMQDQFYRSNKQMIEEILTLKNNLNSINEENANLKGQIELKNAEIQNITTLNNAIISTKGWRLLEKFRKIKLLLKRNNTAIIPKVVNKVKQEGLKNTVQIIEAKLKNELQEETYHDWYLKRLPSHEDILKMRENILDFEKMPLISVVMPVYNTPINLLKEAVDSLRNQVYSNWELCICDDYSTDSDIWIELQEMAGKDKRIKVIRTKENVHISEATNLAISLATGEYIGFLDHDDVLTVDALYEVVKSINEENPDLIYSDEDKLEMDGTYSEPFFKPDWSPHYLLTLNYICHFVVCKKSVGDNIGWLRSKYNGAQDYDFLLRTINQCEKIYHIPKILYHWRKVPTSTAVNPDSKPYAHEAGRNAVLDYLQTKHGESVRVDETEHLFVYNPRYKIPKETKISIIIPTKDQVKLLSDCVESILNLSTFKNYEILLLNNNSTEPETYRWFEKIQSNQKIKVIDAFFDFNWSKLNNLGIKNAEGDVFIFLNNDIKIITPDWLERLAEKALLDEVGTVGGLLLYEDNTIQHAGVVLGLGGWADHVFKSMNPVHYGTPYSSPVVTRNVLASTGACLAISKKTVEEIGGFDEEFIICGSDVEISLRAFKQGYYNVYDPYVKLYHYESKTRDSFIPEIDFELSKIHYSPYRENGDPFYNENLSLESPQPKLK